MDGYNNNRGDENATFNDGGLRESVGTREEPTTENTGGDKAFRRVRQEDAESFARRATSDAQEVYGRTPVFINSANSVLAYVPAESDNSAPSMAVDILNGLGAKAVYVKGNIEHNQDGVTTIDNQALTAPDGTVYVSSNATLSDVQMASHEIVHVKQRQNSPEYITFESVVSENVLWGSDYYFELAEELNQAQFNGRYDIEDTDFGNIFLTEITAYINEFVATDPERAERNFAPLCKDWQAVVDASKQFNKDIGADFSQSAFSMQSEERGQVFTEPDTKEIARDYTNEDAISAMVTGETKNARQKQIESVAGKFGLKIRWSNKVSRGTYNHITKTITINPDLELTEMYVEVFKHEFVHYLERKQGYKRFRDELFASDVFADFCRRFANSDAETNQQAISDAVTLMYNAYRSSDEVSKPIRDKFTRADAEKELIAEFVSKELLKGDKRAMDTIQKMAEQKPGLVQRIRNWIKEIIQSLKGVSQNKTLLNDLEYLEKRLGEVMHSANKISLPFGNKVQYSAEYNQATVNTEISELVKKVQSGNFKDNEKVYLSDVSNDVAEKIYNLTGIDVTGFKVAIEARQIEHILKDHGKNGMSNQSMSNIYDISKIEYTLNNYDSILPAGKTKAYTYMKNGRNRTADTVLYEKSIGDNSYYVIQAVPDAKSKTLFIVSAFIGKSGYKKEVSQLIDANSPDATSKIGSVVTSTNSISNPLENVNENLQHSINLQSRIKFSAEEYTSNLARVYNKKANKQQLQQAITEIEQGIAQKDFRVAEDE